MLSAIHLLQQMYLTPNLTDLPGAVTQRASLCSWNLPSRVLGTFTRLKGARVVIWMIDCLLTCRIVFPFLPSFCRVPPTAAGFGIPRLGWGDRIPNKFYKLYLRWVYVVWTSTCTLLHGWDIADSQASTNYRQGKNSERWSILCRVTEQDLLF